MRSSNYRSITAYWWSLQERQGRYRELERCPCSRWNLLLQCWDYLRTTTTTNFQTTGNDYSDLITLPWTYHLYVVKLLTLDRFCSLELGIPKKLVWAFLYVNFRKMPKLCSSGFYSVRSFVSRDTVFHCVVHYYRCTSCVNSYYVYLV